MGPLTLLVLRLGVHPEHEIFHRENPNDSGDHVIEKFQEPEVRNLFSQRGGGERIDHKVGEQNENTDQFFDTRAHGGQEVSVASKERRDALSRAF